MKNSKLCYYTKNKPPPVELSENIADEILYFLLINWCTASKFEHEKHFLKMYLFCSAWFEPFR